MICRNTIGNYCAWLLIAVGLAGLSASEAHLSKSFLQTIEDSHEFGAPRRRHGAKRNVIGGHPSARGAFPFMASLRKPFGVWDALQHICGGFLVAENVVITAAHCVLAGQPPSMMKPVVHLGRYRRTGDIEEESFEQFLVRDVVPHPEFTAKGTNWFDKDVALLVLEGNSKAVEYAKLREVDCATDSSCNYTATGIGWGLTRHADHSSLSDVLMEASGNGKDTCEGDSGGPLIVDGEVIGIVSWGFGCGSIPGFYASIPAMISWIQSALKTIRELPPMPPRPPPPPSPPRGRVELVSQYKPTYQSSLSRGGYSSLAVDGDFINTFRGKSCSRTGNQWFPWWYVDLGNSRRISRLRIANLKLSFGRKSPLVNFEIRVGKEVPSESGFQNEKCREGLSLENGETGMFDCFGVGRYVSIRIYGRSYLSLCEVQVFAQVAPEETVFFKDPITFRAKGISGKERLGGLKIETENGHPQVLSVGCLETHTGQLLTRPQNCAAVLPANVMARDVRNITLFYVNPPLRSHRLSGRDNSSVMIIDGQLWFSGSNIWRSAWNAEIEKGNLTTLRSGQLFHSKSEMLISRSVAPLSFLAKGPVELLSVHAKSQSGVIHPILVRCASKPSKSRQEWRECQGEHVENVGLGVSELQVEVRSKKRAFFLPKQDIRFHLGCVFWHGVNVWWGAVLESSKPLPKDFDLEDEQLRKGRLTGGDAVTVKVDDGDYGINFGRAPTHDSAVGFTGTLAGPSWRKTDNGNGAFFPMKLILFFLLLKICGYFIWGLLGIC
ncbi:hypothetical protein BSKO_03652 [Bryopsis sp. KO-2023]|nr:hypothetical protein BSKO_03652 [Bryopsis sp. KO-2023]